MAFRFDESRRRSGATAWRRTLSIITISIIALMTASVIGGFVLVKDYNRQLGELREQVRLTRYARQMLMEASDTVLDGLARPDQRPNMSRYYEAMERVTSEARGNFPRQVQFDGVTIETADALGRLQRSWAQMVRAMDQGNPQLARSIYLDERLNLLLSSLTMAIHADLQVREGRYEELQRKIALSTNVVMTLQVLTGLVCAIAFIFAAVARSRESAARRRTVDLANAQREKVARLFDMTDMLQSANDHADANAVLRATANDLLPNLGGALYVFNNSRDRLILSTQWGLGDDHGLAETISLHQCWALKRGKRHINRPKSNQLCCEHEIGERDSLEIPMIARGEILGLLQVHAVGGTDATELEQIVEMATAIADAMSLALANIALRDKLRGQALKDPLTGLYNRRYMEDALQRVARLSERDGHKLSVIMIDLDHFKRLNDQFGHAKGDSVLRDSAAVLLNRLRESDIACRYGGEELLVVLPNCDTDAAVLKAEQLRQGIEALSEPNGAKVSASLGVATLPAGETSITGLLAAADAALYRAKQEGRNRVVRAERAEIASPPLSEDDPKPIAKPRKRKPRKTAA